METDQLNQSKTERQNLCLWKYENTPCETSRRLILEATTGFGKTRVLIKRIVKLNAELPNEVSFVIVPTIKLKEDWEGEEGHIKKWNLKNVKVYVVNSYVQLLFPTCYFLGLDECHRYAGEDAEQFSRVVDMTTFNESMALTATLNDKEKQFMFNKGFKVFDNITDDEAEKEGWVSKSLIFNLGIQMDEEDRVKYKAIDKQFYEYFAKFDHSFDMAQACRVGNEQKYKIKNAGGFNISQELTGEQWRWKWAERMSWDGTDNHDWSPKKIAEYAQQFGRLMDERKRFLYNYWKKVAICKELVTEFNKNKILIFSESSSFANEVNEAMPEESRPFHSYLPTQIRNHEGTIIARAETTKNGTLYRGVKSHKLFTFQEIKKIVPKAKRVGAKTILKECLEDFEKGRVRVLCAVKKLDEGFDVETINMVIMASYTSSSRQFIQRKGRAVRIDPEDINKRAIIINLYVKGTQEEKEWLKKSQKQVKTVISVGCVDDIVKVLTMKVAPTNDLDKIIFDNSRWT